MSTDSKNKKTVCLITMSDLHTDARTLNIINYLKDKVNIKVVAFKSDLTKQNIIDDGIDINYIKLGKQTSASDKWVLFNKEIKKLKNLQADIYWASDFFSLKPAVRLKKKYKAQLLYDSREIYSAIASLHDRKIKQLIQTSLEKHWVKTVDKVIVSGEMDMEYLKKHFGIDVPYYVIMNLPYFRENAKKDIIRSKYNISKDIKLLIYQGMLSEGRGLIKLIKAMQKLDDFKLIMLGSGVLKRELERQMIKSKVEDKVIMAGLIPYEELLDWTCSADIGLNLIENISFSYKLALPNKLFEYCVAGLPTLSSDLPAINRVYSEFKIGELIDENSTSEQISDTIKEMTEPNNYNSFTSECKKAADKFHYEKQYSVLDEIFGV